MLKHGLAAVLLLGTTAPSLAATDDPAVTSCEIAVEAVITTPATYARIGVAIEGNVVKLTYDSKNAAGGLVRDRAECTFETRDGLFRMTGLYVNGQNMSSDILFPAAEPLWQKAGVDGIDPGATSLSGP